MFRITYVLCCCFFVSAAFSCASTESKNGTGLQRRLEAGSYSDQSKPVTDGKNKAEIIAVKVTQDTQDEQKAQQLLSELEQAVKRYDIRKALASFEAIGEVCLKDDAVFIEARKKIVSLLELISIEPLDAPGAVNAGTPFPSPFTARAVITTPEKQFPLNNYSVAVSYPLGGSGGSAVKTEVIQTDAEGFISFTPPLPERAVEGKLCFYFLPIDKNSVAADVPENLRAVFSYKVATTEKRIPTIIAILDYDENNQPVYSHNITATRLLAGLMKQGFGRIGLDEYRELAESDETAVIRAAQAKIGNSVDRFIFGKTFITLDTAKEDSVACTIRAEISVWDFKQALKTNRFTFEYTAEAKTKTQAITLARSRLGESVIVESFKYNL